MTYLQKIKGLITFLAVCLLVSLVISGTAAAAALTADQAGQMVLDAGGSQEAADAAIAAVTNLPPGASPANVARAIAEAVNALGVDTAVIEAVVAAAVAASPEDAVAIAASVNAGVPGIGLDIIAAAAGVTPDTVAATTPEAYEPPGAPGAPPAPPVAGPPAPPTPPAIPGGAPAAVEPPPTQDAAPGSPV